MMLAISGMFAESLASSRAASFIQSGLCSRRTVASSATIRARRLRFSLTRSENASKGFYCQLIYLWTVTHP
jgi:hypothetical protein